MSADPNEALVAYYEAQSATPMRWRSGRSEYELVNGQRVLHRRRCQICEAWKPAEQISRDAANPDGRSYRCHECDRNRVAAARALGGRKRSYRVTIERDALDAAVALDAIAEIRRILCIAGHPAGAR